MSAYVIGDIKVSDPDTYARYAAGVPASSGAYGCRYLVRGQDRCEIAEGGWLPERLVLAEYQDMATVKAWYYSPEYTKLREIRQSASTGNLIFAEGIDPEPVRDKEPEAGGYVIADIEITDMDTYATYRAGVPDTIAAHGGRFLVRGAEGEPTEGDWAPKRVVVIEFESLERAKAWYHSPEYSELKKIRQSASSGNVIFAAGI